MKKAKYQNELSLADIAHDNEKNFLKLYLEQEDKVKHCFTDLDEWHEKS